MELLRKLPNALAALFIAAMVAAIAGMLPRDKVRQHTGGWQPMDFSEYKEEKPKQKKTN